MKLAKTIEEAMDENGVIYSKASKARSVKSAMVIADMLADMGYWHGEYVNSYEKVEDGILKTSTPSVMKAQRNC